MLLEAPPPQRRDVEGDGAEQEQAQDPPAVFAGQATAQHVVWGAAQSRGARGARAARRVAG
jgi:hypothetical protein